jgi:hypothetical protein
MASRGSFYFVPLLLLLILLLASPPTAALDSSKTGSSDAGNATAAAAARLRPGKELLKYKRIRALLRKLNKPSLKTIKVSADNLKLTSIFVWLGLLSISLCGS